SGEARRTLSRLPYPRYYLDFETINFAVPRWRGTRPYQQVPFQWSLHIEGRGGELESRAHLDLSGDHPTRSLADALLDAIGPVGPVFMYTSFERTCLRTLAASCPDLATGLAAIEARLVDLHPIAKSSYYHPDMHGSWSIKALLPTIAPELDYTALDGVADGVAAQQAYMEAIATATPAERREHLRAGLLAYCGMDTAAMVAVARDLQGA
ncbi:MAG: DUF2779 domain-containing protein, partial [Planctomycetes bacterium]|nr:DUF2779 domain-containing protein [Planctomycetota bacterium]